MSNTNDMPDAALLWAREQAAKGFGPSTAKAIRDGRWDVGMGIAMRAEAFRAGQAHERRVDAGLLAALEAVTDDLEAEIEAKRGTVLARTTERDLASVRMARAAITAAKGHDHEG